MRVAECLVPEKEIQADDAQEARNMACARRALSAARDARATQRRCAGERVTAALWRALPMTTVLSEHTWAARVARRCDAGASQEIILRERLRRFRKCEDVCKRSKAGQRFPRGRAPESCQEATCSELLEAGSVVAVLKQRQLNRNSRQHSWACRARRLSGSTRRAPRTSALSRAANHASVMAHHQRWPVGCVSSAKASMNCCWASILPEHPLGQS